MVLKHNELIRTPQYWKEHIQDDLYNLLQDHVLKYNLDTSNLGVELGVDGIIAYQVYIGKFNGSLEELIDLSIKMGYVPYLQFINLNDYSTKEKTNNYDKNT